MLADYLDVQRYIRPPQQAVTAYQRHHAQSEAERQKNMSAQMREHDACVPPQRAAKKRNPEARFADAFSLRRHLGYAEFFSAFARRLPPSAHFSTTPFAAFVI